MDAHEIGSAIYRAARLSPLQPVLGGSEEIAERLGVDIFEQSGPCAECSLGAADGREFIALRNDVGIWRGNFLAAQMIARLFMQRLGMAPNGKLEVATAAWIVSPPPAFTARFYQVGANVRELARPFAVTRTCAFLRLHEVLDFELAVVDLDAGKALHRRGKRFQWMTDAALRQLATKRAPRSVSKVGLHGRALVGLLAS